MSVTNKKYHATNEESTRRRIFSDIARAGRRERRSLRPAPVALLAAPRNDMRVS